ncbi:MAG: segregation and condensation protein A [Candidatus Magasanikbacteria bacterium]|nr:segregation and condensation protein A [Candidatus Magasanikbacteria bacterium]
MYEVQTDSFVGPFDLLLSLIEKEELDISEIAISKVTDAYLNYLDAQKEIPAEELADFLVVAAKLLYLKSRVLLPQLTAGEEEGLSLEEQLKMYREFVRAAAEIESRIKEQYFLYPRQELIWKREVEFSPPTNVAGEKMREVFLEIIERLKPFVRLPQAAIFKTISIKEKISAIRALLERAGRASLKDVLADAGNRTELIVTFLALLELVKQKSVVAEQNSLFGDIVFERV